MARPRKIESNEDVPTVPVEAPTIEAPIEPVRPQVSMPRPERMGTATVPSSARYPRIMGGVCEACGVIDRSKKSTEQYKLCKHYQHIAQIQCSYCSSLVNPDDVIYHQIMNVAAHPNDPSQLVIWCQQYDCLKKHEERFKNKY